MTFPKSNPSFQRALGARHRRERLVGMSEAARRLEAKIERLSNVDSTLLITGETGCGKEEVARALHKAGPRAARPFVAVNCGAMAATLIESQLFGHEKGSFTGAVGSTQGMFRAADGGVVFLDEIGEMPLELQPRLLRVLQEREVTPVGRTCAVATNFQVIAATNRNLAAAVAAGTFREDLLYRINTVEIEVPPLRHCAADIPLFIQYFSHYFADRFDMPLWEPDPETLSRFICYRWPGNVRQLSHMVERVYALGEVPSLGDSAIASPPEPSGPATIAFSDSRPTCGTHAWGTPTSIAPALGHAETPLPVLNIDALRRMAVRQALAMTGGHKGRAAGVLGVHVNTMTKLVEESVPSASRRRGPLQRRD